MTYHLQNSSFSLAGTYQIQTGKETQGQEPLPTGIKEQPTIALLPWGIFNG